MAELLKDNMELERRRAVQGGEASQGQLAGRAGRREVPDMMSWLHCYLMYAAIMCERHPQKVREMWAYQSTMQGGVEEEAGCCTTQHSDNRQQHRQIWTGLIFQRSISHCMRQPFWPTGDGGSSAQRVCSQTIPQRSVLCTQTGHCPWCG